MYRGRGRGGIQECTGIREEGVYGGVWGLGQRGEEDMGRVWVMGGSCILYYTLYNSLEWYQVRKLQVLGCILITMLQSNAIHTLSLGIYFELHFISQDACYVS